MILASHGLIASSIVQATGLLDLYPSAAAAYSLRKLRTAYTGSAIEVRRTNNDVADIGFISTGELDTTALLAFTGTGALDNGFVTKWYDQSGNARNATQTTALNQPKIVSAGSVINENGKAAINFDGSDDGLHASYSGISGEDIPYSNFNVIKNNAITGNPTILSLNRSGELVPVTSTILLGLNYGFYFRDNVTVVKSSTSAQSQIQTNFNLICEGTTTSVYYNGSEIINSADSNLATITRDTISIGTFRIFTPTNYFLGNIQEVILYPSDQSTNRTGIETNINDFYSIY
jgi:hypothetical protein